MWVYFTLPQHQIIILLGRFIFCFLFRKSNNINLFDAKDQADAIFSYEIFFTLWFAWLFFFGGLLMMRDSLCKL